MTDEPAHARGAHARAAIAPSPCAFLLVLASAALAGLLPAQPVVRADSGGPRVSPRWSVERPESLVVHEDLGAAINTTSGAILGASARTIMSSGSMHDASPRTAAPAPWFAPVLSAVFPGAGQGLLRQQRGVVYAAAEVYLVVRALEAQRDAQRERDAYREIARTVARGAQGGERPIGAWAYYERLQYFLESGAFNRTPGAGFTPESDESTFNGSMWRLARETFWRDPDVAPDSTSDAYRRAIAFYQQRAVGDAFLWSWRDAQLEQDVYRQTIGRSNEASRRARQLVGLVIANHALSLVDAYVSVRLRVFAEGSGASQRVGVSGALPLGRGAR
ncbi:MAG: hypothetical protein MUD17_06350 [Gemmatimonadaceae bacterium]|nr:hypothetical protein [Gemmatimonadaceae bacterium]